MIDRRLIRLWDLDFGSVALRTLYPVRLAIAKILFRTDERVAHRTVQWRPTINVEVFNPLNRVGRLAASGLGLGDAQCLGIARDGLPLRYGIERRDCRRMGCGDWPVDRQFPPAPCVLTK